MPHSKPYNFCLKLFLIFLHCRKIISCLKINASPCIYGWFSVKWSGQKNFFFFKLLKCVLEVPTNTPEFFQIFWSSLRGPNKAPKIRFLWFFHFFAFFQLNFLNSGLILAKKCIEPFFQEISSTFEWSTWLRPKMNPCKNYRCPKTRNEKKIESDPSFFFQKNFKRCLEALPNIFQMWLVVLKPVRPTKKIILLKKP